MPDLTSTPVRTKAGRPRNDAISQRRDALLATALDLFLQHGYAEVSLTMLAQEAQVAVRTIYVKFGGKDDLLRAIIAAEAESHATQLAQLTLDGLSFAARMEHLAIHLARRASDARLLRLKAIVFAHPDPSLAEQWRQANPGQLAPIVKQAFAAAPEQFAHGMTLERLWEHFLTCIAGSHAILGETPTTEPEARIGSALSLFMHAVASR